MDLREYLLALVAPVRLGEELVPGVRLRDTSTELGLRLTFEADGAEIHVEVEPPAEGRRFAAASPQLRFSYRANDGDARPDSALGEALCRAVATRASQNEARVLAALAHEATAQREARASVGGASGGRIREVRVGRRLLERAGSPRRGRYYTLSPYVGCLIGCRFCYAQSRIGQARRLEQAPPAPWGSYVDARIDAPEVLARELGELPRLPVKFCPIVSDPYQAIEQRLCITQRCLAVLRDARDWPALVLTRSALVLRDRELLAQIPVSYVGMSIPTADDEVRRHFEPRAASVDARFDALGQLRAAGVKTFAVVQPMLPGSVTALADRLAAAVTSVSLDLLDGVEGAAEEFADPRYAVAADPGWQRDHALALRDALVARGVAVWSIELPPELARAASDPSSNGDAPAR